MEEFQSRVPPIVGVSTSTAGFLGPTLRGPSAPHFVTSFAQFERLYGGFLPLERSFLPPAVEGFFANGGQSCCVARIAPEDATSARAVIDGTIEVKAIGPASWGNRIALKIEPVESRTFDGPGERFKLTAMYWDDDLPVDPTDPARRTHPDRDSPTVWEVYDQLCARESSVDFYETRINAHSNVIRVAKIADGPPAPLSLRMLATMGAAGGDGTLPESPMDYRGRDLDEPPGGTLRKSGLRSFAEIDRISIVCAPDHHRLPLLARELVNHCTKMGDRFAILHANPATDTLENIANIRVPGDTPNAAFYFPWIKVFNPRQNRDSTVPPSGHIAGIYASMDRQHGVHKTPANVVIAGAIEVEQSVTNRHQGLLNPRGVNCIRRFPGRGVRVWGARTCSTNPNWKYVNVRRLVLFIQASIKEGTRWVVFEPNDATVWSRVRETVAEFLMTAWRSGALIGRTPEEAFFVRCDRTTMTRRDITNGRLVCVVGIAPLKTAEFVIFRLTWSAGRAQIEE